MKYRAAILFGAMLALSPFGGASADCGPFSNLAFWSGMTHESVRQFVDIRQNGDWQRQIQQLEERQAQLKDIYARNSGAELTYKGQTHKLFDDELAAYIEAAEKRLQIFRCLAEQAALDELPEMGTASGPDENALISAE